MKGTAMNQVTVRRVLLALAIVCALVFTAIGFGWFWDDSDHPFGWLGAAVVFGYLSRWA
jgi:hypothetical protein